VTKFVLHVPLQIPRHQGFFIFEPERATLLGCRAALAFEEPYAYLKLEDVPQEDVETKLNEVRRCIAWAAVRLDQGITTSNAQLRYAEAKMFDGQWPTAVPVGLHASPMRIGGNHRSEEPSTRLFAALNEGAEGTPIVTEPHDSKRLLACEIFAAVDFESSVNAQFLALTMVLEVLAAPKDRPSACIDLVEGFLNQVQDLKPSADEELRSALTALQESARWLRKESITSSIRMLARKTAVTLGDATPSQAAKAAGTLYGKRSQLVHSGKGVTHADVHQIRRLARECLAVQLGCYHSIRERYP
jgi:hypothetical protein